MRVIRDFKELSKPLQSSAVTIGNFDGVHLAHHALLGRVVRSARKLGGAAVAITFDPHPAAALAPARAPKILTPLPLKVALIGREDLDLLVILRFDNNLARLSPAQFVENILMKELGAAMVHVGTNFRFGHHRAGDTAVLAELGERKGFRVETMPMLKVRGQEVSSSQIRRLLAEGRVGVAGRMLGRPFSVSAPIVPGEGVGRKQTVPTLNLAPLEEQLPRNGVYISRSRVGPDLRRSVTNVGQRPTFGPHRLTVESFLLDFSGNVGEGQMEVEFLHRLRDEVKFSSPEALKKQIEQDVRRSKRFFSLLETLKKRQPRSAPTSAQT